MHDNHIHFISVPDAHHLKGRFLVVDKKLSRREFLYYSSLGIVGLAAPLAPGRAFGALGKLAGPLIYAAIDPPPGGALKDPPEIAYERKGGGLVEVTLDARVAEVEIEGRKVELITYNGSFPAPSIRVRKGDRLRLLHKNSLPETERRNVIDHKFGVINLHTHGWHVSPSGISDNVFVHTGPGEEFQHEFDTSLVEPGAMSFYHMHHHGLTAWHLWNGLAGPLIVEDETDAFSSVETRLMVLKDLTVEGGRPAPFTLEDYISGKEGEMVMINGQVNPVVNIRPGQAQRWRLLNACTARYFKLGLEGHDLYLIGTDGGLLDRPHPIESLLLTPGERADLLVVAREEGAGRLLSLPYDRKMNRLEKRTLATIVCEGRREEYALPVVINREARRLDASIDVNSLPVRRLYLIMANERGYINLKDYEIDPYVLTSEVGTHEVWEIMNISPMDHPFHQHTNAAQILSVKGGDKGDYEIYAKTPAWKDTINVPFMGKLRMLVPVKDFTGKALFHCHILEHEDIGMMGVWQMVEPGGG